MTASGSDNQSSDPSAQRRLSLHLGPLRLSISRLVYAIIISLASLALYDEPDGPLTAPQVFILFLVVIGPVAALAAAHVFVDLTGEQLRLGNTPDAREIGTIIGHNAQFLTVGVTAGLWFLIAYALDLSTDDAVVLLLLIRVVELFALGAIVGRRSGASTRLRIVMTLGYGIVGLVVVAVELLLGH